MNVTEIMTELVLQIGIILFAVRLGGRLAKLVKIPSVLGELAAGIAIGPYALGGIGFPGFPNGLFPLAEAGGIAVSTELYAFATVASIILLFASGLETDLGLFIKYSLAGGLIGLSGALLSFAAGVGCGVLLLNTTLLDPRCLFLGILSTATSVGITARILSDKKKMDSPEGVTILASAVFDDVLGIIMLAIVLGIVAILTGSSEGGFAASAILGIAGKAFGIWLGFTVLGLVFSKQIASFLKLFKHRYDFAILALGIALILAGFFESQGLAMIIGAYIAGLSLSKTDIAAVIQDRIRGLYEFFVPLFFAIMGMMVNVREIVSLPVLFFGGIFALVAILSKIIGCGAPAMILGFNLKGALRIGIGMVPRGEVALIMAGIGLSSGILDNHLFSVAILLTLISTVAAPPLLNGALNLKGKGTRKTAEDRDSARAAWDFKTSDIARLVMDRLYINLRAEGFYVQVIQRHIHTVARKDDISLSIKEEGSLISIETVQSDMPFVKNIVYETILNLFEYMQILKNTAHPEVMKKDILDEAASGGGKAGARRLLQLTENAAISLNLQGETKEEIIAELVDLLNANGKLLDRGLVLADVMERENTMSTGMARGVAMPHAKSDGVKTTVAAIGLKKSGVDFQSTDGKPSQIFFLEVSPKETGSHLQFLTAIGEKLRDENARMKLLRSESAEDIIKVFNE